MLEQIMTSQIRQGVDITPAHVKLQHGVQATRGRVATGYSPGKTGAGGC